MRLGLFVGVVVAAIALPAAAQEGVPEDAMEMQRCIWRCLADSSGANDPAYHRCVARVCNGDQPAAKPQRKIKQTARKDKPGRRVKQRAAPGGDIVVRKIRPRIVYVD